MAEATGEDYKRRQRDIYEANAAGWDAWAAAVAEQAESFNRPLIDAAMIGAGDRVLDLASGAGEPALTAAAVAGPSGHVSATDLSPAMLEVVRKRAKQLGLANMAFQQSDMEALPFEAASFDAVICRFGIMYSPDPEKTAAESLRVLKPGGRAAFMVWGPKANNRLLWTVLETGNRETGYYTADELVHPFCYGAEDSVAPVFRAAGFDEVAETDFRFSPRIPQEVPFWKPLLGMNFGAVLACLSERERQDLEAEVVAAFAPYLEHGRYHLTAHVRIVAGTKP